MNDFASRLATADPVEAASLATMPVINCISTLHFLRDEPGYEWAEGVLMSLCKSFRQDLDQLHRYLIGNKVAWNALCGVNEYTVVVSGFPAENYADAVLDIGTKWYRVVIQWGDVQGFVRWERDGESVALDFHKVQSQWQLIAEHLRELPEIDTDKLRIDIKKEFQRAKKGKQLPEYTGPVAAIPKWSIPKSPSEWAKEFGVSWDTLKRRFKDGTIRHQEMSSKNYRILIDDLPK